MYYISCWHREEREKNLYFQGTYNLVGKADIEIYKWHNMACKLL